MWKDGLDKEARDKLLEDFKRVITINTEDRKDIKVKLKESKEALNGLVDALKEKDLEASGKRSLRMMNSRDSGKRTLG